MTAHLGDDAGAEQVACSVPELTAETFRTLAIERARRLGPETYRSGTLAVEGCISAHGSTIELPAAGGEPTFGRDFTALLPLAEVFGRG